MAKKKIFNGYEWICTDPDSNQYGRQITKTLFEFKEGKGESYKESFIDLNDYTVAEIEDCINSYGYTQLSGEDMNPRLNNIVDQYGEQADWIKAECLFEQDY